MADWREEHVIALVEATLDGYERYLSPEELAEAREAMIEAFLFHPVLAQLAQEQAPREQEQSGDVPIDESEDATSNQEALRKKISGRD